jgi:outer membrane protein assembly factor BamB
VRGRGFSGAPEYRWSEEPGVDSGVSVEPGDALELAADSDAVARLVWEREGERSVTMAEPEGILSQGGPALGQTDSQIVLAQFRGPARPLDPGIGGAPTGRYGGRNTGFGDGQSGPTSDVTETWTRPAGPTDRSVSIAVGSLSPAPAVTGGTVYAGGNDGTLYALDAVDGAELWRVASGPFSSATVAGDTVYVGGTAVRAVAGDDGTEQWRYGIDGAVAGPPRLLDRVIYVSCGYPFNWQVRAIDARDGSERWTVPTDGGPIKPLAIAGNTVYVSESDLRTLAAADGAEQWRYETETLLTAPAIAEGTVYVGEIGGSGAAGFITALDGEDGTVQWRRGIDGPVAGSVAVTDGRVYAAGSTGSGGFVTALDRRDGTVRWVRESEVPFRNPPIVAGGTLYVTDENGRVHGLDAGDGGRQFLYATGDTLVGSPIAANGSLYLVGEEYAVYALGTSPESGTVTRISGE